jgi:anti-sigma-K factor RskA
MSMSRGREHTNGEGEVVELAALADGSLSTERRAALESQVAESGELADRLDEQRRAVALFQGAAAEVEAPASLRARVDAQRSRRHHSWFRPRLVFAGAALAAVLVVAVGVALRDSVTSAQRFHAALSGTDLAPGVNGDATLTKTDSGWEIELNASGLPRLDDGRFYEAWLKDDGGTLVPIGTFNEGREVTLWAGVSPKDFGTITVTRERADGDQASSGEKVLIGAVDTSS